MTLHPLVSLVCKQFLYWAYQDSMALPDSLTSRHFHWEVLPRLRIGRQATDATDAADATCSGDARLVLPETAGDSWNGPLAKWAGEKRGSRLSRHWVLVICLHCRYDLYRIANIHHMECHRLICIYARIE